MTDAFNPSPDGSDKFRIPQQGESSPDDQNAAGGLVSDNIGSPNYLLLGEEARERELQRSNNPTPDRADYYLREGSLSFPFDSSEPAPFILDARQWEIYSRRKAKVQKRIEEGLIGISFSP